MGIRRLGLVASALCAFGSSNAAAAKGKQEQVQVAGVIPTGDDQYVVVLRSQSEPFRYLPIWIGEMEALAIQLRLEQQAPPRPLTLNLLESVLTSSKIRVVDIAIDDLRGGVFIGSVRLTQEGRSWRIDARPSDAIGLAVGSRAPIWVSRDVMKDAALDPEDLLDRKPGKSDGAPSSYEESL